MSARKLAFAAALALGFAPAVQGQIYSEDFESITDLASAGFVVESFSGATEWELFTIGGDTVAELFRDPLEPHDDWLITPGFLLESGEDYTISYWYRGGGNTVDDAMDVYIGTTQSSAGMLAGTQIAEYDPMNNSNTPEVEFLTFTATTTGMHYLGFHGRSAPDQNFIRVDDIVVNEAGIPPAPVSLAHPPDEADNVYQETYLYAPNAVDIDSVTIRLATDAADLDLASSIVLEDSASEFFADPGTLIPGQTYFVRVDAINAGGTTEGPVTTFTVLPEPTAIGDVYYFETFDAPHQVHTDNLEYPELPKGWVGLDLDGAINGSGFESSWYIAVSGRASSPPNALLSRFNQDQSQNDDWIFLPAIETHPSIDTEFSFLGRVRVASFPETVEVRYSLVDSTDPADYGNILDVLEDVTNVEHITYSYVLPPASTVRVALRYVSEFQSQYVVDDVLIQLVGEPTSASNWELYH